MKLISRLTVALFAALAVLFVPLSQVSAGERSATKQGFELPAKSNKKILLFRPYVNVGGQSTGGMFEPNAEWTEQSKANLITALKEIQVDIGNEVIEAPEAYGQEAQDQREYMALFAAISKAVIRYQFFVGDRLPTKKKDNREGVFDWSLGDGVANLPGAQDADYGLFIYNKDAYGSTGRKVLQVLAILGPGISVKSGEHIGHAGLVDLKTGELLWLNADENMGGDLRKEDGARKRARQLLEGFPGSNIKDNTSATSTSEE